MIFFAEVALTALIIAIVFGGVVCLYFWGNQQEPRPGSAEDYILSAFAVIAIIAAVLAVIAGAVYGIHAAWSL